MTFTLILGELEHCREERLSRSHPFDFASLKSFLYTSEQSLSFSDSSQQDIKTSHVHLDHHVPYTEYELEDKKIDYVVIDNNSSLESTNHSVVELEIADLSNERCDDDGDDHSIGDSEEVLGDPLPAYNNKVPDHVALGFEDAAARFDGSLTVQSRPSSLLLEPHDFDSKTLKIGDSLSEEIGDSAVVFDFGVSNTSNEEVDNDDDEYHALTSLIEANHEVTSKAVAFDFNIAPSSFHLETDSTNDYEAMFSDEAADTNGVNWQYTTTSGAGYLVSPDGSKSFMAKALVNSMHWNEQLDQHDSDQLTEQHIMSPIAFFHGGVNALTVLNFKDLSFDSDSSTSSGYVSSLSCLSNDYLPIWSLEKSSHLKHSHLISLNNNFPCHL